MAFPRQRADRGLVNAALAWAALHWTTSPRTAALPLVTWLLTVAVLSLGGPGDDIVFGGPGVMEYGGTAASSFSARCHRPRCCGVRVNA